MRRWMTRTLGIVGIAWLTGCVDTSRTTSESAFIAVPVPVPQLVPRPINLTEEPFGSPKPDESNAPTDSGPLQLNEVLSSVQRHFPLLYAIREERDIASGQRLSAEGAFDTMFSSRGSNTDGTFSNSRFDAGLNQPIAWNGGSISAGWRNGQGNFPIYYGDRKTADGGEFRAGFNLPLLRNRAIDPQRVALRQAQIAEQLANPVIRRAALDYYQDGASAYWSWVNAGSQYRVQQELLELAEMRQELITRQLKEGFSTDTIDALNRRQLANRTERLLDAERGLQRAAIQLSLYLRDPQGDPKVTSAEMLPDDLIERKPTAPKPEQLRTGIQTALSQRPELERFQLQKQRASTNLQLAQNQTLPNLDLFAGATQDVGFSKKTLTGFGPFKTARTSAEVGLSMDLPLQRRDARGNAFTARSQLSQLLAQERYMQDTITAQVKDAMSSLVQTYERWIAAQEELTQAKRALALETSAYEEGNINLVELNIQEEAAADAKRKVLQLYAEYSQAVVNYSIVLGGDVANFHFP